MVESTREIGDKIEQETSLVLLAHQIGPVIRNHWAVENSLHWVMEWFSAMMNAGCAKIMRPTILLRSGTWRTTSSVVRQEPGIKHACED
jgi:hypothetical protein